MRHPIWMAGGGCSCRELLQGVRNPYPYFLIAPLLSGPGMLIIAVFLVQLSYVSCV